MGLRTSWPSGHDDATKVPLEALPNVRVAGARPDSCMIINVAQWGAVLMCFLDKLCSRCALTDAAGSLAAQVKCEMGKLDVTLEKAPFRLDCF